MTLGHLWAGWRGEYIGRATDDERADAALGVDAGSEERCVFCRILSSGLPDDDSHVLARGRSAVAILNAYPYSSGHLMCMPVRHVDALESLDADEHAELWELVTTSVRAVRAAYEPDGINVGANLGRAAGAGIPGHLHVHIVPRWNGDTNFMTSVAGVRVVPEPLERSAVRLRAAWPA